MLKTIFLTALTLAIAIGGGAASVWLVVERDFEFGTVTIGNWTAYPKRGTPAADPYSKARFSREADLALGYAEGLVFTATRDASGALLRRECDYRVEGSLPPARFWTLSARDADGGFIAPDDSVPALHSYALLRQSDNTVATTVSRNPVPGNWLAVDGSGAFALVLTLYDTAVASSARIADVELPQVLREGCDG
ncbi:DUF1214 domain-containing protein [Neoaquamicrobium sediminum]|uniref:DUF1214 domain-containing protein n=1 Tax=Neoaquamicrobium sediminum TaxID=1849104 RepID=UPI0015649DFA|nr:DUF1214 domain-containing protein [Mesorhizobium sediminum]NRC54374.1 DUF1214 domain-containing protein [Mesorhizobium sediminum]